MLSTAKPLVSKTRRKDYRSGRQLRVAVLKEVGNRGELEGQLLIAAMMAQGLRNGGLRQQSPHRPADRSSPAAEPYCLLGTPLVD